MLSRDVTRLEAVARMRRDFIVNVSHELKTPLTVVIGFVETMQDLDLDARQREQYLGLMHASAFGNLVSMRRMRQLHLRLQLRR